MSAASVTPSSRPSETGLPHFGGSTVTHPDHSLVLHPPGRHVAANGTRLWIEEEGDGEPVLLLAGGPATSHVVFHPVFSPLAKSHRSSTWTIAAAGVRTRSWIPDRSPSPPTLPMSRR